jgi:hypothetical protein
MVSQNFTEQELNEQHVSDIIQDHIEMDDNPHRYIFEVLIFTNRTDEYPEVIQYYLEAEDCNKYLEDSDNHALVHYKQVLKTDICYGLAIYNTFFKNVNRI